MSIINFNYTDLDRFFISLTKSGYTGHVCLFAGPNSNAAYMQRLAAAGVEIIPFEPIFPFIVDPHPDNFTSLPIPIVLFNYRHFLYYDYLLKNKERFANVLLTDIRDVVFQREPFSLMKEDALYIALENKIIGECQYHRKWLLAGYDEPVWEEIQDDRMSCAGTTMGTTAHIMHYLKAMLTEIVQLKNALECVDQIPHNVLLHRHKLEPTVRMDNADGLIMTVGIYQDPTKLRYDKEGYVLGKGEARGYIIHQGDRHMSVTTQTDRFIFDNYLLTYLLKKEYRLFLLGLYFNNPIFKKAWRSLKGLARK